MEKELHTTQYRKYSLKLSNDCQEKVTNEKKESESEVGKLQKENDDAKEAIKGLTHEKQKVYSEVKKLKEKVK